MQLIFCSWLPTMERKESLDSKAEENRAINTRGKKICVQHILGLWSGFIESCFCNKCNEHRSIHSNSKDNQSTNSKQSQMAGNSSGRASADSKLAMHLNLDNVKVEVINEHENNDLPSSSSTENLFVSNDSSMPPANNPYNVQVNINNSPDQQMIQFKGTSAIDVSNNSDSNYPDDDLGIEVSHGAFDTIDKGEAIYTSFRRNEDDPLNYVECTMCFKKIKESSMKQHYRTHTGIRPHKCDLCGTSFTRRGDVCRHKRVVHGKVRPYDCRKCNKKFPDRTTLVSHLVNHDKTTFYECSICLFKFGRREFFDSHVRFIHPTAKEVGKLSAPEDAAESQLEELEKEDEASGATTVTTAKYNSDNAKKDIESTSKSLVDDICRDGADINAPVPLMQLQSDAIANATDEDLVGKILNAAVAQATNTLSTLAAVIPARNSKTSKRSNKYGGKTPIEIIVKACMGGIMKRFIIQIQGEDDFDLQSSEGMDLIMKLVSELGEDKGKLEGPVQIELFKPARQIL